MKPSKSAELERANLDAYFRATKPNPPLDCQPGDTVGFARYFLKSIGASSTDPMWRQTGTVKELRHDVFALVAWEGEPEPRLVHRGNLAKPGPNLRWCE